MLSQPLASDEQAQAVRRGIAAQGFSIVTTTTTMMTPTRVEQFYTTALTADGPDSDVETPPLSEMISTMTCAPTTAMLLEVMRMLNNGNPTTHSCVPAWQRVGGIKAWSALAHAGVGDGVPYTLLHASDSITAARRETHFWFPNEVVTAGRSAPPEASTEVRTRSVGHSPLIQLCCRATVP